MTAAEKLSETSDSENLVIVYTGKYIGASEESVMRLESTDKIMLWDSANNMSPVSEAVVK